MTTRLLCSLFLIMGLFAMVEPAHAQTGKETKKKSTEPPKKAKPADPLENLDANQKKKLKTVEKMFGKLFGLSNVPESARDEVRIFCFAVINGAHKPDRGASDKLANDLMQKLSNREIKADLGVHILGHAGNTLGEENLSRESLELLLYELKDRFDDEGVSKSTSELLRTDVEKLFKSAEKNEKYVADRTAAKEAALKAKKEKEESQEKKKADTGISVGVGGKKRGGRAGGGAAGGN